MPRPGRDFDYPMPLEGRMARSYLWAIEKDARELREQLRDTDNLPGWVQAKIVTAQDRIQVVNRYLGHKISTTCDTPPEARPNAFSEHDPDTTWAFPVVGVRKKAGAVLNLRMLGFLSELRKKVPFNIVVTSGVRTPWAQAQALAQDCRFDVYVQRDLVAELQPLCPDAAAMQAVLENQVSRGRYLSPHMRGDAVDLRVRGLSYDQREQLLAVARGMVGTRNAIDEGDHIHIQKLGNDWVKYVAVGAGVITMTSGLLTLAAGAAAWYYRDELQDWLERR